MSFGSQGGAASRMEDFFWWHSIPLDDGRVTPGTKDMEMMRTELAGTFDPLDLRGKSVLDVGAWTGGFTIEAKRRGAGRVVAMDHVVWNMPHFRGREAFNFATKACGFEIEQIDKDVDVPALDLSSVGSFDVVLFLGVFYHLVDPIATVRELARLTGDVLVLETYVEETATPQIPSMRFLPGAELNNDPTNWWAPNVACVDALLRFCGFSDVDHQVGSQPNRGLFHAYKNRSRAAAPAV